MHTAFDPDKVDWSLFLTAAPSGVQFGAGASYATFRGMPYQRGMGIGSVFRWLLNRFLIPVGREVGKEGVETGKRILTGLMTTTKPPTDLVVSEGREAVRNLLDKASGHLAKQRGRGPITAFKSDAHINRKRNLATLQDQPLAILPRRKKGTVLKSLVPPPSASINYFKPTKKSTNAF